MKTLTDPTNTLARGLADIRAQFKVPEGFPPEVVAAAEAAAKRAPGEHLDRTGLPFVTLDPASSTDLDQAFLSRSAAATCCCTTQSPTSPGLSTTAMLSTRSLEAGNDTLSA